MFLIKLLKSFIDKKPPRPVKARRPRQGHAGEHYNLKEIYDRVNAEYFENQIDVPIKWFGNKEAKPKTKITLGSYHLHKKEIKINRVLDQSHVPDYFISFIVYHEMLHHVFPPLKKKNIKRRIHHPEFVQMEKQFEHYDQVKQFRQTIKKDWFSKRN